MSGHGSDTLGTPREARHTLDADIFSEGRLKSFEDLLAGLRSRVELLEVSPLDGGHPDFSPEVRWDMDRRLRDFEADALSLNREVASHGKQLAQLARWRRDQAARPVADSEVRLGIRAAEEESAAAARASLNAQSVAEDAQRELRDKFSEMESWLARQVRDAAEGAEQLRSEMGRTLKLARVETARTEGALEAQMTELSDRAARLADRGPDSAHGRAPAPAGTHALEALVRASAGDLRAMQEEHRGLDLQVASITASVCACGEEQERLARQANERDTWLRAQLGELAAAGNTEGERSHAATLAAEQAHAHQAAVAQSLGEVESRISALVAAQTVQVLAADGSARGMTALEAHVVGLASQVDLRTQQLEARFCRDIELVADQAELAAEVARAAEASAERGEADGKESALRLEERLADWLEARREVRRDAREEQRREVTEAAEEAAATAAAVASTAAGRAASSLRALGARAEEEAVTAESCARRAEDGLRQFRSEESEAARRLERRTEGLVGQLRDELRIATESSRGTSQHSEAMLSSLSAAVGDVREEMRTERRKGKEAAEVAVAVRSDVQVTVRNEVTAAAHSLRGEFHDYVALTEGQLLQLQNQHAQDIREQLVRLGDQVVFLEERLAPDVVANLVRRDVEEIARDVVFDEIRDLRGGWCQKADYKFDCTMQCLHVLYLKVSLSPAGALSSLQRAIRENLTSAGEPPHNPGGPGDLSLLLPGSPPSRSAAGFVHGPFAATEPRGPPGLGTPGGPRGRSPSERSPRMPLLGHARHLGDYSVIE